MIGREQGMSPAETGVDFYLSMDYNWNPCEAPYKEGRMYSWGSVIFGKAIQHKEDKHELMEWTRKAYANTVQSMVWDLNLKTNAMAVAVQGREQCILIGLTDSRTNIKNCVTREDFYFEGYSNGRLIPCFYSSFEPYKTLYDSAVENKRSYPKRKAVGIIIRQSSFQYSSEKDEAVKYVELCAKNGIDVITLGLEDRSVQCKNPLKADEIKMLSTNSQYSVMCDYDKLQENLKKIVKNLGGVVDPWWEAMNTENWLDKQRFVNFGALDGNELCCNELAKQYYFGITDSDVQGVGGVPFQRVSYEEDWERAERHFQVAAKAGIGESMLFLGKIHQDKALRLREEGNENEAEKEEIEAEKWLREAEKKNYTLKKISEVQYMGVLVNEIMEPSLDCVGETDFEEQRGMSGISMALGIAGLLGMCIHPMLASVAGIGLIMGIFEKKRGERKKAEVGIVLSVLAISASIVWYTNKELLSIWTIVALIAIGMVVVRYFTKD